MESNRSHLRLVGNQEANALVVEPDLEAMLQALENERQEALKEHYARNPLEESVQKPNITFTERLLQVV